MVSLKIASSLGYCIHDRDGYSRDAILFISFLCPREEETAQSYCRSMNFVVTEYKGRNMCTTHTLCSMFRASFSSLVIPDLFK